LEGIDAKTVAQIVPSIVVAIFVFAVGTAFVMVQIVPPARGTRAPTTLQGRRMLWTIAPAPGLIIGSVLAVLVDKWAGAISVTVLLPDPRPTLQLVIIQRQTATAASHDQHAGGD
jgi:hypothetical protein